MAAIRGLCLVFALIGFFLIATPLQWLVARVAPSAADRIPTFFCRSLLRLLRVRIAIEGKCPTGGPVIVASNHVSWIDILALGSLMPFCFLAKSEVSRWPILSAFAQVQGTVFVDRKRRRTILSANKQMAANLEKSRCVLLFPEGTTVRGPEPGRFHTSHFAAARDLIRGCSGQDRVNVRPVAIAYSSPNAAWVGEDDLASHAWRTLRAPPLRCLLTFGEEIPYLAKSDRKQVAAACRIAVVDMLRRAPAQRETCTFELERATAMGA